LGSSLEQPRANVDRTNSINRGRIEIISCCHLNRVKRNLQLAAKQIAVMSCVSRACESRTATDHAGDRSLPRHSDRAKRSAIGNWNDSAFRRPWTAMLLQVSNVCHGLSPITGVAHPTACSIDVRREGGSAAEGGFAPETRPARLKMVFVQTDVVFARNTNAGSPVVATGLPV
jgi:hypothetical protein